MCVFSEMYLECVCVLQEDVGCMSGDLSMQVYMKVWMHLCNDCLWGEFFFFFFF